MNKKRLTAHKCNMPSRTNEWLLKAETHKSPSSEDLNTTSFSVSSSVLSPHSLHFILTHLYFTFIHLIFYPSISTNLSCLPQRLKERGCGGSNYTGAVVAAVLQVLLVPTPLPSSITAFILSLFFISWLARQLDKTQRREAGSVALGIIRCIYFSRLY